MSGQQVPTKYLEKQGQKPGTRKVMFHFQWGRRALFPKTKYTSESVMLVGYGLIITIKYR